MKGMDEGSFTKSSQVYIHRFKSIPMKGTILTITKQKQLNQKSEQQKNFIYIHIKPVNPIGKNFTERNRKKQQQQQQQHTNNRKQKRRKRSNSSILQVYFFYYSAIIIPIYRQSITLVASVFIYSCCYFLRVMALPLEELLFSMGIIF